MKLLNFYSLTYDILDRVGLAFIGISYSFQPTANILYFLSITMSAKFTPQGKILNALEFRM